MTVEKKLLSTIVQRGLGAGHARSERVSRHPLHGTQEIRRVTGAVPIITLFNS